MIKLMQAITQIIFSDEHYARRKGASQEKNPGTPSPTLERQFRPHLFTMFIPLDPTLMGDRTRWKQIVQSRKEDSPRVKKETRRNFMHA